MAIESTLKEFGMGDKAVKIYLALLKLGPASVRVLSFKTSINRGTTYDILKELMDKGVVSYYHKDKKQYFVAEDPDNLKIIIKRKKEDLDHVCRNIIDIIPQLKSLYNQGGERPVARFYEGYKGIRLILDDVLGGGESYYVYSTESIRPYLYKYYPNFTEDRIKKKILVKVIAIGKGGKKRGLDERKWLTPKETAPTYTLIYHNKLGMISVDQTSNPVGVIIEDEGIYKTQKLIFESLWNFI